MKSRFITFTFIALIASATLADDAAKSPDAEGALLALQEFNPLIGEWRGVGMPQRGSARGAWKETAEWVWDFSGGQPAVRQDVEGGRLFKSARLTYDGETKEYLLNATLAGESETPVERTYRGALKDTTLTLKSESDADGFVHVLTLTKLNEKRTVILHQKRKDGSSLLTRVAEVGYTREGTRLAEETAGGPECIVTGGAGTISVQHAGQTYYVCCTGCKQAFDDDPEGTIAAYQARLAEKKAAKADAQP